MKINQNTIHLIHSEKGQTCCGIRWTTGKVLRTTNVRNVTCLKCLRTQNFRSQMADNGLYRIDVARTVELMQLPRQELFRRSRHKRI